MNARPLRLSTAQADFETLFQQRLHWSADTDAAIEQRVADILADVKARGDAAVLDYTRRFAEAARDRAKASIAAFPDSPGKDALLALADLAVERDR